MSEEDRNFSKDALDLNENYSMNEQPYQNTDTIDDEGIILKREEDELIKQNEIEKEKEKEKSQKENDRKTRNKKERCSTRETFSGNI